MRGTIPARPVTDVAWFYPLHNVACPPAQAVKGALVIARMMRGQRIHVSWEQAPPSTPQILFCRPCKLGVVRVQKRHKIAVACIHGHWTQDLPPKASAANRLGATIAACSVCSKPFSPQKEWSTGWTWREKKKVEKLNNFYEFYESLTICGTECRERAWRLFPHS